MTETLRFKYDVPSEFSDFDPKDFIKQADDWLIGQVKPDDKVAISVSGGVDSTVAAYLMKGAVGDNVYAFFLEDGCRRLIRGEPESNVTQRIFQDFPHFEILNVENVIKPHLIGLSDGEAKRKAFISAYRDVSDGHIRQIGANWIADGTIGPDIAETEGNYKSQHNVGWNYGSAQKIEVLASLAKPHVRKVAIALGLPEEFAHRIPCPGPAQILRTVGKFIPEKLLISQVATDRVEEAVNEYYKREFGKPYFYDEATGIRTPFQYFGVALDFDMYFNKDFTDLAEGILKTDVDGFVMNVQTTVVPEGGRRPERPIYRPVAWMQTRDDVGYEELKQLSKESWERLKLPRILWQVHEGSGSMMYAVAIRAVESDAAAEAKPVEFAQGYLHKMGRDIGETAHVANIAYDVSYKPPATIEFE